MLTLYHHNIFVCAQKVRLALVEKGPWLCGDAFGLADIALLPYVWRLERLGFAAMWADKSHVADWFARAGARPSWRAEMEAYPSLVHLDEDDYDDDLVSRGIDLWPKIVPMIEAA